MGRALPARVIAFLRSDRAECSGPDASYGDQGITRHDGGRAPCRECRRELVGARMSLVATSRGCAHGRRRSLVVDSEVVDDPHFEPETLRNMVKELQRGQEPLRPDPAAAYTVVIGGT